MTQSTPKTGDTVERIAKDYTGGRTGTVIETFVNDGTKKDSNGRLWPNRARVHWTRDKRGFQMNLRTWVRFQDLKIVNSL